MTDLTPTTAATGQRHRRGGQQAPSTRPERNTGGHAAPAENGRGHGRCVLRFDKIEILAPRPAEKLRALLPLAALQAHAVTFKLEHCSLYQYRAKLLIVAPDPEFWNILAPYADCLGRSKICALELDRDTVYQTELEARAAADTAVQHLHKKYHRRGIVTVVSGTAYWEDRRARTNLMVYARPDKRTGQPLLRVEWRLKGAAHIYKKTGIATISDLRDFDFAPFMGKYYLLEAIDHDQLGRWLNKIPRGREVEMCEGG